MSYNDTLIEAYKNRKALRAEFKQIDVEMARLRKREEEIGLLLDDIDQVTHIIEGVALSIDGASIYQIAEEPNPRFTRSYENVRDGRTGLRLCEWKPNGGYDELALNMSMGPRQARKAAISWVLTGELPEEKDGWMHHYAGRIR